MKNVLIYILFVLLLCPNFAAAKEKILTGDDISCSSDGTYCTNLNGTPFTGKFSQYNGETKTLSNYQNGYLSGLTTVWNADGKIVRKTYYKKVEKTGWKKFFMIITQLNFLPNIKTVNCTDRRIITRKKASCKVV